MKANGATLTTRRPDGELAGPVEHLSVFLEVRDTTMSCKKYFASHICELKEYS